MVEVHFFKEDGLLLSIQVDDNDEIDVEGNASWMDFKFKPYSTRLQKRVSIEEDTHEWARSLAWSYKDSPQLRVEIREKERKEKKRDFSFLNFLKAYLPPLAAFVTVFLLYVLLENLSQASLSLVSAIGFGLILYLLHSYVLVLFSDIILKADVAWRNILILDSMAFVLYALMSAFLAVSFISFLLPLILVFPLQAKIVMYEDND